jgi:hypothetical protein
LNGYLQRLVANVRNPGGSIRPILGSVFAGPQYGETPEIREVEEKVLPNRPESRVPQHADQPFFERTGPARIPIPGRARQDKDFEAVSEERTSFKPLMAMAQHEEIQKPERRAAGVQPQSLPEQTEPKTVLRDLGWPLTVKNLRGAEPKTSREAPQPDPDRKEDRDLSGRSATPTREPDEIQIHIGRIEVTAVPPAPVRPAPRPANKSLDLGAYLKRRDGGAR